MRRFDRQITALLGAIGARAGGANILRATVRVTFWGALALLFTAGIGRLFGTSRSYLLCPSPISRCLSSL
jgi:hypothetical protein